MPAHTMEQARKHQHQVAVCSSNAEQAWRNALRALADQSSRDAHLAAAEAHTQAAKAHRAAGRFEDTGWAPDWDLDERTEAASEYAIKATRLAATLFDAYPFQRVTMTLSYPETREGCARAHTRLAKQHRDAATHVST